MCGVPEHEDLHILIAISVYWKSIAGKASVEFRDSPASHVEILKGSIDIMKIPFIFHQDPNKFPFLPKGDPG